jgi:hypothetical protein
MHNKNKIIIRLLAGLVLLVSFSGTVYAIGEYTPLAPLPGTTNPATAQTNLETYIPGVFRLSMGIAAVMAFVMITFGGIMYATSDAISGKSQGREYVTNAVWGLLLVIGAWALLNTINPKILNFSLDVNQITSSNNTNVVVSGSCSNCQLIPSNIPVSSYSNNNISSAILPKITTLNTLLNAARVPWLITEAYPPTVNHRDPCHRDGTCIDARPVDRTPNNINAFAQAATAAGFSRVEYEVATNIERANLIKNGVTAVIIVVPGINAPHFSVYN